MFEMWIVLSVIRFVEKKNQIVICLPTKHLGVLKNSFLICQCVPDRIGIWKHWFFKEMGKTEYPEKNLLEQGREPTTNSTHIWRRR